MSNDLIVSISGIRGIFGTGLNPDNLTTFAAAYGVWIRERAVSRENVTTETSNNSGSSAPTIVVGRDTRQTGTICNQIVIAALNAVGCNVIQLGIAPTPTVAMAVLDHKAEGGIILSASHNPAQWNALKLLNANGEFLDAHEGAEVLTLHDAISAKTLNPWVTHTQIGHETPDLDAIQRHIQAILDHPLINRDKIASKSFKVSVDAINGAGSEAIPMLLGALGAQAVPLYCTPDGNFPHNPEPLPEHLQEICSFTKEQNVDLGVVSDPDADRLAIVDETGALWGEEYTQAAAFDFVLNKQAGPVATNLSSSRVCDDVARKYGQSCYRSAVGEINVVKEMQAQGAVIGGEGNGGVIDPQLHYGRDSLIGIAMILQLLAERDVTASEYRASLPHYEMSKQKRHLDELGMSPSEFLERVARAFAEFRPNTLDGVKIDFDEGWVHLRKSNTEPIVRFYSEASSQSLAEELIDRVIAGVEGD